MTLTEAKSGALCVLYALNATYMKNGIEHQETARQYFHPFDKDTFKKRLWHKFIRDHINGAVFRRQIAHMSAVQQIIKAQAMFDVPAEITHRVNDKSMSIINRKRFRSGREALTG